MLLLTRSTAQRSWKLEIEDHVHSIVFDHEPNEQWRAESSSCVAAFSVYVIVLGVFARRSTSSRWWFPADGNSVPLQQQTMAKLSIVVQNFVYGKKDTTGTFTNNG